jgi:ammonia channel protein AmtB
MEDGHMISVGAVENASSVRDSTASKCAQTADRLDWDLVGLSPSAHRQIVSPSNAERIPPPSHKFTQRSGTWAVFFLFQSSSAVVAPLLVTGVYAERLRFALRWYILFLHLVQLVLVSLSCWLLV